MADVSALPRLGVVLVNLGTPEAPTVAAVRRFLREFLSDRRVISVPRPIWWLILNCLILPRRPQRVAKLYQTIWRDGDSPMRTLLLKQSQLLQWALDQQYSARVQVLVRPAMTYGLPALAAALDELQQNGCGNIVLLPLFPQFSATSTAPVYDGLQRWCASQRDLPGLCVIKDYHAHPAYIAALAASVREHWAAHGRTERLLFSFHGIPKAYAEKGDPYATQCEHTARAAAAALALGEGEWAYSFQSRFGLQEWVKPYTDALLQEWAAAGVRSVQVACPAFSADCLETLEEIALQNRELFLHAGGQRYEYIAALNDRADHIALMQALVVPHLDAAIAAADSA